MLSIEHTNLGIVTYQNVPKAREPEVVSRMAAMMNGAETSGPGTAVKVGLVVVSLGFLAFAYRGCVHRGACRGF